MSAAPRAGSARDPLLIGTRASALARRQTEIVIQALHRIDPSIVCRVELIRTQGDEATDIAFSQFESQGVFVRRIEEALLGYEIDLAVHSYKDMPSISTADLTIAAFLSREDPRDALVTRTGLKLSELPGGASVGTGSPRRQAQLGTVRQDLQIAGIRGNVDTRVRRVAEGNVDAIVLAAAGLSRLGRLAEASELLDPSIFVPAAGQGIIAVQTRSDNALVRDLLARLDDSDTRACAIAERAVAISINAGCQTPLGAYAEIVEGQMRLSAFLAARDGSMRRASAEGEPSQGPELGAEVGRKLARRKGRNSQPDTVKATDARR